MTIQLTKKDCPFLPLGEGHQLKMSDSQRTLRHGRDNDDDYYEELNADGDIVAKYHSWHHMDTHPTQNSSTGWIKFDLEGNRIDSGTEYIDPVVP